MQNRSIRNSIKLSITYLIFGFVWIYFSDRIALKLWFQDAEQLSKVQTEKGFLFVAVSGLLIGLLTYVFNAQILKRDKEKYENFKILQQQLRQNRLLINSTTDLIWSIDTKKRLISFNRAFSQFINEGLNVHVSEGIEIANLSEDPSERKQWNQWYDRVLEGQTFHELTSFEYEGQQYYLDCSFYPVFDQGKLISASMFANDITSIKRAELEKERTIEELRDQGKFIKTTLDNLTIGIAVNDTETGQLTYANEQFFGIYGWDPEDLIDVTTFFEKVYPDPEYRKEIQTQIIADMESGDPTRMRWNSVHITTKKGEERVVDAVNIPLPEQGLMVSTVWDVTVAYQRGKELEESQAYLDILSKQASDAIVSCDVNGDILFTNTQFAQLFETTSEHPVQEWPEAYNMYHIFNNTRLEPSEVCLNIALRKGHLKDYRYRLVIDGREKILEASGSSLVDQSGTPKGAMVVIRDVTEQVQNQIQQTMLILEAVDKERNVIARNIHDGLTQQIATTYLSLNNLRNPELLDEKDFNSFKSSVQLLKECIQESRDIAHNLMPESIRDYGLIEGLKSFVNRHDTNSEIACHFEYNEERRIEASKEYNIYRIVQQACTNATTHSNCSEIYIRLKFSANEVVVEVEDNGDGIDLNMPSGRGIGILSMRQRAQKYGGKFEIQGRDGEGTTVRVTMPIGSGDTPPA